MLSEIKVRNYALIEDLSWSIESGFTAITGETGSGKSILLGALHFVLGERADVKVLRDPEAKCVVEVNFHFQDERLKYWFDEQDLDFYPECIIRRELSPNGRSRLFVNDGPATIKAIKELIPMLIDIHSQNQTLLLSKKAFKFDILDAYAGILEDRKNYQEIYQQWREKSTQLKALELAQEEDDKENDYQAFILKELEDAQLEKDDPDDIEQELLGMNQLEESQNALKMAYEALENDNGILSMMNEVNSALKSVEHPQLSSFKERWLSSFEELRDLANESESLKDQLEFDEEKWVYLNDRFNLWNSLLKKHKALNKEELLQIQTQIAEEQGGSANRKKQIEQLYLEINKLRTALQKAANHLTKARTKVIPKIEKYLVNDLALLKMTTAWEFRLADKSEFDLYGANDLQFYFSSNPGMQLQILEECASGGELARVMLVLKKLLAENANLPTLIFDEIDTGVSGEVAQKMGQMMKKIAESTQLIVITHLAQIAALCDMHIKIHKENDGKATHTYLTTLDAQASLNELAAMISGDQISEAALQQAAALRG